MRHLKRVLAAVLTAALCLSLAGCSKDGEGIDLAVSVGGAPETLDPIYAETITDRTIVAHLYENLLRVAQDTNGVPAVTYGMAKSYQVEEEHDGTVTYTFKLRGAKWSDGREVRAQDFVYAWRRLADPVSQSPYAPLLSVVVGYDEARAAGDMTLLQVSAKNDSTLVVVLEGNYDWFLTDVCTSPATMPLRQDVVKQLKETADAVGGHWWSDPTALVTNGPYQTSAFAEGASLTTVRSEHYSGTQPGPRQITFRFADTAEEARALYEEREIDMVWPLTEDQLADIVSAENGVTVPELGTYTVLFDLNTEAFADVLVRQALHLVIDRNALAQAAGVTAQPAGGLVPPGVPGDKEEDFRTCGGALLDNDPETYEEKVAQAKELLAQAGYDSGAGLGELTYLYVDEGTNGAVAEALAAMWRETLRVKVTPTGVTEQELWTALRSGEYDLAATTLSAVGNDAECFLMKWTSDSQDNVIGYANSAYDTLMSIIAKAEEGAARMGCLHDAEALLLSDCALAPLYTKGTAWDLRDTLTGLVRDARGWYSFSGVVNRAA